MKFLSALILCAAALAFSAPVTADLSQTLPVPASIKDSVPWFAARSAKDGESPWTRTDLQKMVKTPEDRVALVYFATWCVPCRAGIVKLRNASADLEKNHIRIVFVNIGERDADLIRKWADKLGVKDRIIVMDNFGRLTEGFGLIKENETLPLPRTLLLDSKLRPVKMISGEGSDWPSVLWTK